MSRLKKNLPDGVSTPFILIQVLALVTCGFALAGYFFLPPQIPLFYSLALSSQQLTTKEFIFVLPGLSVLFGILNSVLILRLQKYDVLLIRLFSWITVVCIALLLFSLIRILYIVI
ncbi:MAG: hypothetical protein GW762_01045 [Candidatus Pacebacteria bacterium]|nr:hypothetical protein [Candidatus Paceibacterota bacterium]